MINCQMEWNNCNGIEAKISLEKVTMFSGYHGTFLWRVLPTFELFVKRECLEVPGNFLVHFDGNSLSLKTIEVGYLLGLHLLTLF